MSRILIADDAPDAAETLAVYLRMDGHEVRTAADGVEALAKMAVQPPDVLVVDLIMPRKNGWEVLDEMAAKPELAKVPVVVLSGFVDIPEPLTPQVQAVLLKGTAKAEEVAQVVERVASSKE